MRRLALFALLLGLSLMAHALPFGLYLDLGFSRFSDAEKTFDQNVKSMEQASGSDLSVACFIYAKLKRYGKLAECTDRLDVRIRAGEKKNSDFMIMPSPTAPLPDALRAMAALELGNPLEALARGQKALALVTDEGVGGMFSPVAYKVELLQVLGIASSLTGQRTEAEKYLSALHELSVPYIGGQQWRNLKDVGQAKIHLALGNHEKALEFLQEEHYVFPRLVADILMGGGDSISAFYDLPKFLMLGKALMETGKLKEAKDALDALVNHKRAGEYPDVFWVALSERGRLAEKEGDAAGAAGFYRKAIEIIEQQRSSINTEAAKIGFAGDKQKVYGRLITLLFTAGRYGEAFEFVERSKSRALVDMLATKKDFAIAGADPEKTRLALAMLDQADSQSRQLNASPVHEKNAEQRSLKLVRQDIAAAAPDLSSLVSVGSVPLAETQSKLAEGEQLVEFYYQDDVLFAFVLDQKTIQAVKLDGANLAKLVQDMRSAVENPGTAEWINPAKLLHARLIKPIESLLVGKRLIVVAHGALHYLPFNALMAENGSLFIDRYTLRMLPAASVINLLKPVLMEKNAPTLTFGNPDLGDAKLDLAFAEGEARAVAKLVKGSRLLLRKDASETNFRRAAGLFSRIHFATHGKFQAESPLDSGLYLARDAENDGLLKVSELYSMQINADLVTLSACEMGLGKIDNGDDVVGLSRGFLYAGARSVISSLWSVDDNATAELMGAFYVELANTPKAEALRAAQLKTRTSFPHPFFWAAFQLTGRAD